MGIYLNPGKNAFEEAMNSEIFVDKTEMLRYLNSVVRTKQKYVSVSRPRRFGKTMAADMICAYYDRTADSKNLFEQTELSKMSDAEKESVELKSERWDKYLNRFNVIRIVMTDFIKIDKDISKSLERLQRRILNELSIAYPDIKYDEDDFAYSMDCFYHASRIPPAQELCMAIGMYRKIKIPSVLRSGQIQHKIFLCMTAEEGTTKIKELWSNHRNSVV